MARNELRPVIKLRSTAGTGFTYVTRKNRRNDPDRLQLRKYDPLSGSTTRSSGGTSPSGKSADPPRPATAHLHRPDHPPPAIRRGHPQTQEPPP